MSSWFGWVRLITCLSIVLSSFVTPGVAGASAPASLKVEATCEIAYANLSIADEASVVSVQINGQDTRHLAEAWNGRSEISFTAEVAWEVGEPWSRTKVAVRPEACDAPTPTDSPSATTAPSETPGVDPASPTPTPIPTETETQAPTDTVTATPTATLTGPTETQVPTETATLETSAFPTATSTEVAPSPTEEVIPKDCFSGRRASGEGTKVGFCAGEEVFGWEIHLDDGRTCSGGSCWLPIAPVDGWVLSGVVNPWTGEVPSGTEPWIEPACSGRRTSGDGTTARFCRGEEVFGVDITLDDGKSCSGGACWLPEAPLGGWVTTGVINPWPGEVPDGTQPWYPYGAPPPTETPTPSPTPEETPVVEIEETQESSQPESPAAQNLGITSPNGWYQADSREGELWVRDGTGWEYQVGVTGENPLWLADWTILIAREDGSLLLTDRLATFTRELGVSGKVLGVSTDGEWVKISNDGHPVVVSIHGARYGVGSADSPAFSLVAFPAGP